MSQRIDLAGRRFGRLLVVARAIDDGRVWECRCDCGGACRVRRSNLLTNQTHSCGCLLKEVLQRRNTTHGLSHLPEYRIWAGIKKRCYNSRSRSFKDYGARGITVCARWLNDFPAFLADMGKRPSAQHSIERIENDGSYSPENCRWILSDEQSKNRRSLNLITWRGETHYVSEWARRLGFPSADTIKGRIRLGWSIERTLSTPAR